MSLFLKYRPQTFADLVGQTAVRRTLQNALKAEKPAHAYLFTGSRGTGKTSTARIFAKGLNCQNMTDGDPCGTCSFCTGTADGSLVDVIEIDAASNRGIDEIRDLREKINFAPNVAQRKVYIIDEVHMMTKEAFNALLKTLEEPPDHAFFCLATTELHKVPETIKSRCQTFSFQRFTLEQLVDRLQYIADQESITAEQSALDLIARKAEGGLRDAISLLEQVAAETENKVTTDSTQASLGISDTETLEQLYAALQTGAPQQGLDILRHLGQNGLDFRSFGHDFLGFLRERMLQQLGTADLGFTLKCIEEFEVALQRLKTSPIIELPLEIAIINLTQSGAVSVASTPAVQAPPAQALKPKIESPAPKPEPAEPAPKASPPPVPKPEASAPKVEPESVAPNPEPTPEVKTEAAPTNNDDGFVFEGDSAPTPKAAPPQPTSTEPVATPPAPTKAAPLPPKPLVDGQLDASSLQAQMENLAVKAGIPVFAKKSFMTCSPSVDGNIVTFATGSEFHREKLDQAEIKTALLGAIKEVFKVDDYQLRFVKDENSTPTAKVAKGDKASVDDFLDF